MRPRKLILLTSSLCFIQTITSQLSRQEENQAIYDYFTELLETQKQTATNQEPFITEQILHFFQVHFNESGHTFPLPVKLWYRMNVGKNNVDNDGLIQSRAGCSGSVSCAPSFIDLTSVQNYACWCFFGENYGKGRGPPKNVIDQICQKLQFCRRCIAVDSATDDESCNVAERGYKSPGFRDLIVGNIKSACDSVNKETCQYRSCTCELQFSQAIVQLFFSGYVYDPFFKHEKGYSWNENCPPYCTGGNCGGSRTELDCCGEYPERVPFNVKNRACCSKRKTYVMSKEVCCEDGSVVGFLESCPTGKTLENIIEEIEEEDRVLVAENTDSFSVPLETQTLVDVDPESRLVRDEDEDNLSSFTSNSPCLIQTMDLAFIIDGSGSVGQENFDLMKKIRQKHHFEFRTRSKWR